MILIEIRKKSISFSSAVKRKERDEMEKLESEIKVLEYENNDQNFDKIKQKQEELKSMREKKLMGVLIRSKARWVENGEKASKYFCNLERRNFI